MEEKVKLRDGHWMPKVGLGTYQLQADECLGALDAALGCGYRLIDTATVYRNEAALAEALFGSVLGKHQLTVDDVFVTSKLAPADHGYEEAIAAVQRSRQALGYEQEGRPLDLYLVHWPGKRGLDPASPEHIALRRESWRGLEECVRRGLVRSIGVSNYERRHLVEMEEYAEILPAVNQVEAHPYYIPDAVGWCNDHNVFVQAYASLGRGLFTTDAFLDRHKFIAVAAEKHGVGVGTVFLRWALQKGWGVLPKSKDPHRILENARVGEFGLSGEEMGMLDGLGDDAEAKKLCWDPKIVA
jgi:diketogulonate reductase-like aldo/keto reductase